MKSYIEYIDEQYNADRLTHILTTVSDIIGAHVLNIAKQDYDPQGASVTMLVSEGPIVERQAESFEESPRTDAGDGAHASQQESYHCPYVSRIPSG